MVIHRAHKIALDLTPEQEAYFRKCAGISRLAYNWALAEWNRQYEAGEKPTKFGLQKQFNAIKREQFPFVTEISATVPIVAIAELGDAFNRFFKGQNKRPKFKYKGKSRDTFKLDYRAIAPEGKTFYIERLGRVKAFEELRFDGKILITTFSREANRWFVSITIELEGLPEPKGGEGIVGVDVGIKTLATLSTGETFENPKALNKELEKLQKLSRDVSRKVKGSANRKKAVEKLARHHARIANIRKYNLHAMTTEITQRFDEINIEDLNVAGMVKNRRLARSISDASFGEIRRQLTYKAESANVIVNEVDRFYPSSKTCSCCGIVKKKLTLAERLFKCDTCGFEIDRDLNAAINLKNWNPTEK